MDGAIWLPAEGDGSSRGTKAGRADAEVLDPGRTEDVHQAHQEEEVAMPMTQPGGEMTAQEVSSSDRTEDTAQAGTDDLGPGHTEDAVRTQTDGDIELEATRAPVEALNVPASGMAEGEDAGGGALF
nr:unnamed protein product [Digitaria exilis]